jgi:hypothetical protein
VTTTENDVQGTEQAEDANGTTETTEAPAAEAKNPTHLDLVKAVWKLGYDLSGWGERDLFCVDGVNGYLRHLGLPELREVDGNMEVADSYLDAWHAYHTWTATGEVDPTDDQYQRNYLARSLRAYLRREQPKPIETMNEWLVELGIEPFAPPAPPRHAGRYDVSYTESREVNSARIQEALRREFGNLDLRVTYVGRIA